MPYFGLLDSKGKEVKGGGYHRIDAGSINFKLSPASSDSSQFSIINTQSITWKASQVWKGVTSLAMFDESDSVHPFCSADIGSGVQDVGAESWLIVSPGQFRMDWIRICAVDDDNSDSPDKYLTRIDKLIDALRIARDALDKKSSAYRKVCTVLDEDNV